MPQNSWLLAPDGSVIGTLLVSVQLLQHPGIIALFAFTIVAMLLLDLGVVNRKMHAVSNREAAIWSAIWIGLAMAFSLVLYFQIGGQEGLEKFSQFQACYWIEKALSVDNLFVFILVFNFFNVPREVYHKVLFWGILGAIIFRAIFIFSGIGLINLTYLPPLFGMESRVNVLLTVFGFFLIYAGYKSWFVDEDDDEHKDFSRSPGARIVRRFFPVTKEYDGDRFFTVENGVKHATPLLVVVSVIEFTDLIFAVDSIPAIVSIAPNDPFILYTSNIFAILGLRALFFLLSNFMHMFRLLKYGLAIILAFIGFKMLAAPWLHISSPVSLSIVGSVLMVSTLGSLLFPGKPSPVENQA